jgi:hypothetical protein
VKDASFVTSLSSTPNLSTIIEITFDLISDISFFLMVNQLAKKKTMH